MDRDTNSQATAPLPLEARKIPPLTQAGSWAIAGLIGTFGVGALAHRVRPMSALAVLSAIGLVTVLALFNTHTSTQFIVAALAGLCLPHLGVIATGWIWAAGSSIGISCFAVAVRARRNAIAASGTALPPNLSVGAKPCQ